MGKGAMNCAGIIWQRIFSCQGSVINLSITQYSCAMRIVFGWNNFRIRSYQPFELGVTSNPDAGFTIELRQSYFHFFWIPFFGLGKKWAIRKEGKLYELPAVYEPVVAAYKHGVKSPWYTYLGPLLILAGGLSFWGYSEYQEYRYRQNAISYFKRNNAVLEAQLRQLSDKDIITLNELTENFWDSKPLYAKVEKVNGDVVTVTPVSAVSNKPMDVEDSYNRLGMQTASLDISLAQLLAAFPKKYDSSSGRAILQYGRPLLNNERNYLVKEVVRHFGPILGDRGTGSYGITGISMALYNAGWPAVVSAVKTLEGSIDWSESIGMEVPGGQTEWSYSLELRGRNYKTNDHYKFLLTLTDSTNNVHQYEIDGVNMEKTIREL